MVKHMFKLDRVSQQQLSINCIQLIFSKADDAVIQSVSIDKIANRIVDIVTSSGILEQIVVVELPSNLYLRTWRLIFRFFPYSGVLLEVIFN